MISFFSPFPQSFMGSGLNNLNTRWGQTLKARVFLGFSGVEKNVIPA